jgi:hypothetical protein
MDKGIQFTEVEKGVILLSNEIVEPFINTVVIVLRCRYNVTEMSK